MKKIEKPDWGKLFSLMLSEPGKQAEYYSLFHNYSLGNQALAISQMLERGIPIGPIASFNAWKKLGRQVQKGEKAIALWMPIIKEERRLRDDGTEEMVTKRFFVMKNNWFALCQTDPIPGMENQEVTPPSINWDYGKALGTLGITEVPFDLVDGNVQGFARPDRRQIAINPLAAERWKTIFHELAHCLLHATEEMHGETLPLSIEEAEAEAVAYLCCASLGLPGLDESRGYIQGWLRDQARAEEFSRKHASRVFQAADRILKAGHKDLA